MSTQGGTFRLGLRQEARNDLDRAASANMINPYSTAFTRWWCHSGRYMRLTTLITGHQAYPCSCPARPAIRHTVAGRSWKW